MDGRECEISLTVNNATEEDEGDYSCEIGKHQCKGYIEPQSINIFATAIDENSSTSPGVPAVIHEIPIIQSNGSNITVGVGEDVTIPCEALNIDEREWRRFLFWEDGSFSFDIVTNSTDSRLSLSSSSDQLTITGVMLEDEGVYQCVLSFPFGQQIIFHFVRVMGKYAVH